MLGKITAAIAAQRAMLATPAGHGVAGTLAAHAAVTLVGTWLLWPHDQPTVLGNQPVISGGVVSAEVTGVRR